MKREIKIKFSIIILIAVFLNITLVFAQDQNASANVGGAIDVSVSNNLDYGTVIPGNRPGFVELHLNEQFMLTSV